MFLYLKYVVCRSDFCHLGLGRDDRRGGSNTEFHSHGREGVSGVSPLMVPEDSPVHPSLNSPVIFSKICLPNRAVARTGT